MNYKFRKQLHEDATNNSFEEDVAEIKQELKNGADPEEVFTWVDDYYDDVARVKLYRKWNIINTDGEILSDLWFDYVYDFYDNFARVQLNGKYNFIKTNGKLLREDLWFDSAGRYFYNRFADVRLNGKACQISAKGNLYDYYGNPIENVTESKRRVVRLTESQLRKTIERVVTQCLNERKRR